MSRILAIAIVLLVSSCGIHSTKVSANRVTLCSQTVVCSNRQYGKSLPKRIFLQPNTKYIISDDFSLDGDDYEVASNCELYFNGGKLSNGTIIGKETGIKVKNNRVAFSDVYFKGSFLMPIIRTDYFEINSHTLNDLFQLTSSKINNAVYINHDMDAIIPSEWNGVVIVKSNTNIYLNANIVQSACSFVGGNVLYVRDCKNVTISGSGHIIGDVATHTGEKGECIYGIFVRNASNIKISGITCEQFWGDGIYIWPGYKTETLAPSCERIIIDKVVCDNNMRQGLSVIGGKNIIIKNSSFINTGAIKGVPPSAGIDIEPDGKGSVVDSIFIDNCKFINNGKSNTTPYTPYTDIEVVDNYGMVSISNCEIENFFYGKADNIAFDNCKIKGRIFTSSTGIGHNVMVKNSRVGIIHNNLIKNGNIRLMNTEVIER